MSTTNHIEFLLKMQRKQMSADAYTQLLKIVNESAEKINFFKFKKYPIGVDPVEPVILASSV
jgi:hypothetical protein